MVIRCISAFFITVLTFQSYLWVVLPKWGEECPDERDMPAVSFARIAIAMDMRFSARMKTQRSMVATWTATPSGQAGDLIALIMTRKSDAAAVATRTLSKY